MKYGKDIKYVFVTLRTVFISTNLFECKNVHDRKLFTFSY